VVMAVVVVVVGVGAFGALIVQGLERVQNPVPAPSMMHIRTVHTPRCWRLELHRELAYCSHRLAIQDRRAPIGWSWPSVPIEQHAMCTRSC